MRVIVLTIGDELLAGHVVDTNFTRLAAWFTARGHAVVEHASVGDDAGTIARMLLELRDRCELVVVTGGLGPTPDDVTVAAVASALGRAVVRSGPTLSRLEEQYRAAGRTMQATTRKIADVVEGAALLENPVGQAPCQWIEARGRAVVLLPGVPAELAGILEHSLGARVPEEASRAARTYRTIGIPESRLAEMLIERGVTGVAYLPWSGGVDVRVPAGAPPAILGLLRQVTGDGYFGEAGTTLEQHVVETLAGRGETLAVAESLTGGALAAAIVSVPGASEVFLGGVTAYANALKVSLLGVGETTLSRTGAVSVAVAREMAEGVRTRTGSDWALATTGIAGPTGATEQKPVGLVCFGIATPRGEVHAFGRTLAGDRKGVLARSVVGAMDLLRRALAGLSLPEGSP